MPDKEKVSKWTLLSNFIKSWGVFMAVVGVGTTLFIKLDVLTFSSAKMKYETEKHMVEVPNDVEVYKQGQEFIEATEALVETRDSIYSLTEQIVADKKNSEDAIKSRANRDSLLLLVVKGEQRRDSVIETVVKAQATMLSKIDSLKQE